MAIKRVRHWHHPQDLTAWCGVVSKRDPSLPASVMQIPQWQGTYQVDRVTCQRCRGLIKTAVLQGNTKLLKSIGDLLKQYNSGTFSWLDNIVRSLP